MLSLSESLQEAWRAERRIGFYDLTGMSESFSFAEFGERVAALQEGLQALGVGPGTVVAVMGPTSSPLAALCAAVWQSEATLTVLATPTRLSNLEQFLAETLGKLSSSKASLMVGQDDIVMAFKELAGIPVFSIEELAEAKPGDAKLEKEGPACALIQFSSGTTRDPKPILLSQQALLRNSRAVLEQFPGGASNHSCVSWLPLYHDMGLIGCLLMPILAPGDLTLMGPEVFAVRPLTWLEAISTQRATTSSAPNFALAHCVRRISDKEVEELDLSCWQISMVGAEPVRPGTLKSFAEKFKPAGFSERAFSPVYGLAEATLAVSFSPLGEGLKTYSYDLDEMTRSGTVSEGSQESPSLGRPLKDVEIEIRDEDGKKVGEGKLGDVWVKSPSLMLGVLGEQTGQLNDGWLQTGDAGFLVDGELHL
ncbi:MAG: AMP-binding protein, partial [Candidatus Eremiobacteraeota bacterium]|nr:AMP-binding protein [Candidatus Eremiobacteraeota bacterium]